MKINEVKKELQIEYLGDSYETQEAKRIAEDIVDVFHHIVIICEHTDKYDSYDCENAYDNIAEAIERWKVRNDVVRINEDEIW